jgi:hypothetical protein
MSSSSSSTIFSRDSGSSKEVISSESSESYRRLLRLSVERGWDGFRGGELAVVDLVSFMLNSFKLG